jgi:hypothetical protein
MLRLSIKMIVLMGLMALPSLSWAGPVVTTTVAGSGWWFGVSSGNYGFHRPYSSYGYSPYLWSPWRPRVSYDWWHYKPVQGANIRTMEEIAALGEIKNKLTKTPKNAASYSFRRTFRLSQTLS